MAADEAQQWYVRRGKRIHGPYPNATLKRYLLLGRIRLSDRISVDGLSWQPLPSLPKLIPPEMRDLESEAGRQAYRAARARVEERGSSGNATLVRHERRRGDAQDIVHLHHDLRFILSAEFARRQRGRIKLLILMSMVLLLGLLVSGYFL